MLYILQSLGVLLTKFQRLYFYTFHTRFLGGDPGGPYVPNHFQRGFRHSGAPLGIAGGPGMGGPDKWGGQVVQLDALFYTDDGLVTSTKLDQLQGKLGTIIVLFYRIGIWTNNGNISGIFCRPYRAVGAHSEEAFEQKILCRPCHAIGTQLEESYKKWMAGEGFTHQAFQRLQVQCPY